MQCLSSPYLIRRYHAVAEDGVVGRGDPAPSLEW